MTKQFASPQLPPFPTGPNMCIFYRFWLTSYEEKLSAQIAFLKALTDMRALLVNLFKATNVPLQAQIIFLATQDAVIAVISGEVASLQKQIADLKNAAKKAKCPGF